MKKTISVDIRGRNFIIDEAAYAKLSEYLEDIKKHLGKDANIDEVMGDIESSIAEKFQSMVNAYKNVITFDDVEQLIKVMGTAKDFDEAVGEPNGTPSAEPDTSARDEKQETEAKVKRKLYRDTENAVLAGVAAGLAAYFDIDPVLLRILFVVFTFTGGFAIPLYIILWIAMPEAKTVNQKLEMQGQSPTLSALERMTQAREQKKEKSTLRKILEIPFTILRALAGAIQKIWRWIMPVLRILFGSLLIIGSLLGLGALGVGTLYTLLNINSPYKLNFVPISELAGSVPFICILTTGFFSLAIPILFFLFGGIALLRKKTMINFSTGFILVALWMISGITCTAVSLRYLPDTYAKYANNPTLKEETRRIDSEGVTALSMVGSHIRATIGSGTTTTATINGRRVDLDRIEIKKENNTLTISQKDTSNEAYCIGCELHGIDITIRSNSLKTINAKDGASIVVSGNLNSQPEITADNGSAVLWDQVDGQPISANLSARSELRANGTASAVTLTVNDSTFYAPTLESKRFAFSAKGHSVLVVGETPAIHATSDEGTRILYAGTPKITGLLPKDQAITYQILTQDEYEKIRKDQEQSDDASNPKDSVAVTDGTSFFLLKQGGFSEPVFEVFTSILQSGY